MPYELLDDAPTGRYEILPLAEALKTPMSIKGDGYDKAMAYSGKDMAGGMLRGAGSIGATLLTPYDLAAKNTQSIANPERRSAMDGGLQAMGVDTNSRQYQVGKLLSEVAGTSGAGGMVANGLSKIPGIASSLPGFLQALRTGGMSTGVPSATTTADIATRAAGGAANGLLSAGLLNPENAVEGGLLGAALPVAVKGAGAAGAALVGNKAPVNAVKQATIDASIGAGYQIPPNMVNTNLKNQIIESISGKQATQQLVSLKNNDITESLVRKAIGIADDVPLSQTTLQNLRKTAGTAYADVASISPQAAADLEALKVARNESQGWFKAYNRSASPNDLNTAKQFKTTADGLETALETHAADAGKPELIPALRNARKEIAKTYTVGRALNDATGQINSQVLGRMYDKQLPLSDGLDVVGRFAAGFPTINKANAQIGSPAAHNLKAMASMAMGGGGYAATGPFGAAAAVLPFITPPIARSIMFSKAAQNSLLTQPPKMQGLLGNSMDELLPLMYRNNPALLTSGR